jgi:hypothetical protein
MSRYEMILAVLAALDSGPRRLGEVYADVLKRSARSGPCSKEQVGALLRSLIEEGMVRQHRTRYDVTDYGIHVLGEGVLTLEEFDSARPTRR